MPRPLKIWLCSALAICCFVLVIGYFDAKLAGGLFWTFWHSESAISFWVARGLSLRVATFIAVVGSTIAVANWFWLANQDFPFLKKFLNPPKETRVSGWISRAPYAFLPLVSFVPDGGVWFSIAFSRFFRLNKKISFVLINIGNIAKNLAWGSFLSLLAKDMQIIAGIFALTFALILAVHSIFSKLKNPK